MLKRYYGLSEAAEFLSAESKQPISKADVMELATCREIRLYIWAEGILAIFEDEGAGDRFVRTIHSFRGYIRIPSHIISPTAKSCQFRQIFLAYDIRGEPRGKIPFVIPPEFIGIVESRGDPYDMGALGLEYTAFGPFKPREFTPSIDEMVVQTADLLGLVSAPKEHQANHGAVHSGAHVSNKLALLNQAATRFWANADRDDRATHRANKEVVSWLVDRGYKPTLAEKAASIIRPEWAPVGRKPDE